MIQRWFVIPLFAGIIAAGTSCVSIPYYRLDKAALTGTRNTTPAGEAQFERGKPHRLLDSLGWVLGIPAKIVLFDRRVDNHRVGVETEDALQTYLEYNGIRDVKIRVNQYAPLKEFRRLVRNKDVGWGWRYSIGVLSWIYQTILPGRLIGGDNYNPYTDTINIYSDVPAIAIHEGGHAKDFAGKSLKGTYAVTYIVPFFTLYAEGRASNDAISYLYAHGSADEEREGYNVLYPAMGTYVGGMFFGSALSPLYYLGVIPGHIVGRSHASKVDEKRAWRPPVVPLKRSRKDTEAPLPESSCANGDVGVAAQP